MTNFFWLQCPWSSCQYFNQCVIICFLVFSQLSTSFFSFFSLNIPSSLGIYMHVYTVNYMISAIHNSISFLKVLYLYFFLFFGTCSLKLSPRISWFLHLSVHFLHATFMKIWPFHQKNICFHPWWLPTLWSSITLPAKTNLPSCTHFDYVVAFQW